MERLTVKSEDGYAVSPENMEKAMERLARFEDLAEGLAREQEEIARLLDITTEELVLGYRPSENSSHHFRDIEQEFEEERSAIVRKYEAEMKRLENTIDTLNSYITALKDTLRTKDEMIAMFKKKLADDGNNE